MMERVLVACLVFFSLAAASPIDSEVHSREKRNIKLSYDRLKCNPGDTQPPTRVDTLERVESLRATFSNVTLTGGLAISAYIIPTNDAHQSEYVSAHDERRVYISGFSGSAGVAVVLANGSAALWTDGRYFLQADEQLSCNWILMKSGLSGVPSLTEWLREMLPQNSFVGANPSLLTVATWQSYETELEKGNIHLRQITNDLVDQVWTNQPASPNSTIFVHDVKYAGKPWQTKVDEIRKVMEKKKAEALVVTDLMEVAWLYNLRASDIDYNPVFVAYAIVLKDELRLYLAPNRVTPSVRTHLNTGDDDSCSGRNDKCVQIMPYTAIFSDISNLNRTISKIWISKLSSYGCYSRVSEDKLVSSYSPIALMKAMKNSVERQGMANSHKRDAVALITFMAFLEKEIESGKQYTEMSAAAKLKEYRSKQADNMGLSFPSISSVGSNGAIIHYKPTKETDRELTTKDMYLLDSGGQYLDGTTDVTRTFHFGTPTDFEKEAYTLVLMGSIDLARAVWPEGVYGRAIDAFARGPLWRAGLDYRHGTGHGIGHFLSVHEGPARIRIGYRPNEQPIHVGMFFSDGPSSIGQGYSPSQEPLLVGMFLSDGPVYIGTKAGKIVDQPSLHVGIFLSDEPGYYEDGKFGVRLETIVEVVKDNTKYRFDNMTYMTFNAITLVPFEPKLINLEMLDRKQRSWLNAYHKKCRDVIGPLLTGDAKEWLNKRTKPVNIDPNISSSSNSVKTTIGLFCLCFVLCFYKN